MTSTKSEHGYEIKSFDCDKCNWTFFSKAASYVHKKMHHHSEDLEGGRDSNEWLRKNQNFHFGLQIPPTLPNGT